MAERALQLALYCNPETTFEKIVLIEGMTEGGKNPATTTAIDAANSAYSTMSWPSVSIKSRSAAFRIFAICIPRELKVSTPAAIILPESRIPFKLFVTLVGLLKRPTLKYYGSPPNSVLGSFS